LGEFGSVLLDHLIRHVVIDLSRKHKAAAKTVGEMGPQSLLFFRVGAVPCVAAEYNDRSRLRNNGNANVIVNATEAFGLLDRRRSRHQRLLPGTIASVPLASV
jgi:hypothetical protein